LQFPLFCVHERTQGWGPRITLYGPKILGAVKRHFFQKNTSKLKKFFQKRGLDTYPPTSPEYVPTKVSSEHVHWYSESMLGSNTIRINKKYENMIIRSEQGENYLVEKKFHLACW
jgi:hypothetical protein